MFEFVIWGGLCLLGAGSVRFVFCFGVLGCGERFGPRLAFPEWAFYFNIFWFTF